MPFPLAVLHPAAHAAQGLQVALPAAPLHGAVAAPAVHVANSGRSRSRMAAALCLPSDPATRRARVADATFTSGMLTIGGAVWLALGPAFRDDATGNDTSHSLRSALEWGGSGVLALAGCGMVKAAVEIRDSAYRMLHEGVIPATAPTSPTSPRRPFEIELSDAANGVRPVGEPPAAHDIENPPPQDDRPRAHADNSDH